MHPVIKKKGLAGHVQKKIRNVIFVALSQIAITKKAMLVSLAYVKNVRVIIAQNVTKCQ